MTTGTKVFLAVFALIVGILVVYYGVVMPGNSGTSGGGVAKDKVKLGNNSANGDKPREPNAASPAANPNANPQQNPSDRGAAPPPREPAPTAPAVTPGVPTNASTVGGLLSEGLREAGSGGTGDVTAVAAQPPVTPFLPLIGLNAGDMQPAGADESKGDAPNAPEPAAGQPAHAPRQPTASPAPAQQSMRETAPAAPSRIEYLIQNGDTFVSIAEDWFGDETKWSLIARENPTIDPQKLKVGQKIFLPPKEAAIVAAVPEPLLAAGETLYVVESGDTLIAIARDRFKDDTKWEDIYALNKATIGPNPAALKVGMKLKLPKP